MGLVLALSLHAARLVWLAVEPVAPPDRSAPILASAGDKEFPVFKEYNPFLPRASAAASFAEATEIPGGLRLHGVRADGQGGGSAIIAGQAQPQLVYRPGQEVAPGLVLAAIAADHVVLAQGKIRLRLALAVPSASGGSASPTLASYLVAARPAASSPAPRAPAVAIDPARLIAEAGLLPRTVDGRITGYTLLPRGGGETLRRAGLASGDVLVALNGNRITPERYTELQQELTNAPEVQLTVERGSETRTITLQTGR
jgi:general secretion pathway protein C